ncbi:MAG: leucine-rich repeat domain-containing protein, partial [Bacteroidota bacterium]
MSELALQLIAQEKKEKTGKLDLGNTGLTDIPKELFELTWLEELNFSSSLWNCNSMRYDLCSNNYDENYFDDISLAGIENLKRLERICLDSAGPDSWGLDDLEVLGTIKSLKYLGVANNRVDDIEFIRHLDQLEVLNLSRNDLDDIQMINGMNSLRGLNLSQNPVYELTVLLSLSNLRYLDLTL